MAAIERVIFKGSAPVVVALTGGWGEGKTYFWKEEVVPKHGDRRPGYVSVFGADSLAAIRERVALVSSRLPELAESGVIPDWLQKVGGPLASGVRQAAKFWGGKIGVSDSIAVELLQSFGIKEGWILCLDDVERLSASIGFDSFLGYVSELRDKWKLKVVLIFNREPIDADKGSVFHRYQEKVIDRTVPFALDLQDAVDLAFRGFQVQGLDMLGAVLGKAEVLQLRNIRLLVKARRYFEEIAQELGSDSGADFLRDVLSLLLLFTYVKFSNQKPDALTFAMISKYSEWTDRFRDVAGLTKKKDRVKQPEDEAKELLARYGYMMTDDLGRLLMSFVQDDILDTHKLQALHIDYTKNEERRSLALRFKQVWDTQYHGTLTDNSDALCDAIEAALKPYMPHIPPGELDFALFVLSKLGREHKALEYFEEFKRTRGRVFEELDEESMPNVTLSYRKLKAYFDQIVRRKRSDSRTMEEVLASANKDGFISQRDGNRLAQFSANDFVTYFVAHDQPKLTSKLRELTRSGNDRLQQTAFAAAKKISSMNKLNRMRMEGMGLVPVRSRSKKTASSA